MHQLPRPPSIGKNSFYVSFSHLGQDLRREETCGLKRKELVILILTCNCFGGILRRAGFSSAMASNLTFQSRNVLSKKVMVKKEVIGSVNTEFWIGLIVDIDFCATVAFKGTL